MPVSAEPSDAGMGAARIVAILVAYRPCDDLARRVESVLPWVERLYLVDNAEQGLAMPWLEQIDTARLTRLANRNRGGLAGAYNLAVAAVCGTSPDTTHVMFLDEDTDTAALAAFLASSTTREAMVRDDVAAVAPLYVERATGLPGAHIQLRRFSWMFLGREPDGPVAVTFLINSMSLWRLDALRRIGRHNTVLAVDHVDTDYCLRAKRLGYRLILNPAVRFLHSIGARRQYRFLGRTMQSGGHGPERREAIARNTVLLARHYAWHYPAFAALCAARLAYECLGILLAEDDKWPKIRALASGAVAGVWRRYDA